MNVQDILDISQPIYDDCPSNPAFPKPRIRVVMEHGKEGWLTEHFDYYNHIGTHIDAPYHRFPDGRKSTIYSRGCSQDLQFLLISITRKKRADYRMGAHQKQQ